MISVMIHSGVSAVAQPVDRQDHDCQVWITSPGGEVTIFVSSPSEGHRLAAAFTDAARKLEVARG